MLEAKDVVERYTIICLYGNLAQMSECMCLYNDVAWAEVNEIAKHPKLASKAICPITIHIIIGHEGVDKTSVDSKDKEKQILFRL